jgi:hypothetical protein
MMLQSGPPTCSVASNSCWLKQRGVPHEPTRNGYMTIDPW